MSGSSGMSGSTPSEPAQAEPAQAEPAQVEPAQVEPAQSEPAQSEPASIPASVVSEQNLLWSEEFDVDGPPDPHTWSYDVGFNNGWGNNELQTYTSDSQNVNVENGNLVITVIQDASDNSFTSARIKTDNKFSFTYGTLVSRIKFPDMDAGLWPAFWTMGSDFYQVGWPKSGEIDIAEMGQGLAINEGKVNHRVVSAAHWDIFGQYATYARSLDATEDLTKDFHEYKLEWTPTKLATYVDNVWIWEIDIGDECPSCAELHQPHHILFNMAVGGGFTSGGTSSSAAGSSSSSGCASSAGASSSGGCTGRGPDDITAPLPADFVIDWVRLYDNTFTQIYTPSPTPAPTVSPTPNPTLVQRQPPPTKQPTPQPTQRPTPQPATRAPVTPLPVTINTPAPVFAVTNAPILPVTNAPNIRQPDPVTGGGKAGKAGGKRSGSRSRVSGGKSGKGFSSTGVRQPGTSGGKGKGKAGKGNWSRSGTSATSTGRSPTDATPVNPGATPVSPAASPTDVGATTRQTPLPTRSYPPPDPMDFEPVEDDRDEESPVTRLGPQSLVVEPFSGGSTRTPYYLSMLLSTVIALGLMTGVAGRW